MKLFDRLRAAVGDYDQPVQERNSLSWLADQYMQFNGLNYQFGYSRQSDKNEGLDHSFEGYVAGAYKSNGIVFACIVARLLLFSEVEFAWQNMPDRKLFTDQGLDLLQNPAPGVTTQDMLAQAEVDLSLAGNAYWTVRGDGPNRRLRRMRPDWVSIVSSGDPDDLDSQVIGYVYQPGGMSSNDPVPLFPQDVAHYTMIPDPTAVHRGMSWLTPIIGDIQADSGFTSHKKNYIQNAAVSQLAVMYPPLAEDQFKAAVNSFKTNYEGSYNSGKTIHISGGADLKPLQSSLKDLDFKSVQGGGETRIALASRVPAVVLGIAESLQGSALTTGNYQSARRQFSDGYAQPHWRSLVGAFGGLVSPPSGVNRLWFDDRNVSFLREDQKDLAEVQVANATAIRQLVDGGYEPDSVVSAINANDLTLLTHTGKLSVQLQPPSDTNANDAAAQGRQMELELYERREQAMQEREPVIVNLPDVNVDARTTVDMPVEIDAAGTKKPPPPPPEVHVQVDAPVVHVDAPPPAEVVFHMPKARRSVKTVERDESGNIISITEQEEDDNG